MKELTIREIQLETLEIMKKIDSICRELNLKYFLFYGTLIGAIRHKGFIPWDDDLDILMPRKDYDLLAEYFECHKDELQPLAYFSHLTNRDYPFMIARVTNTSFTMVAENEKKCGMGTFIDIYPLDAAADGKIAFTYMRARFYSSMYYLKSREKYAPDRNKIKNILKCSVYLISKMYTRDILYKRLTKIAKRYDLEKSSYVTCLIWGFVNNRPLFFKDDFESVIRVPFEDTELLVPANYDKLLRSIYGNYMQLPPEKDRVGHHNYRIYAN